MTERIVSDRTVTRSLFETVTTDTYVISASGKFGNPHLSTIVWFVETAKERGQRVTLVLLTNETLSSKALLETYARADWGYDLESMSGADVLTPDLGDGLP